MNQFTVKGKTFNSPHSDKEVRDALKLQIDSGKLCSNFASDLVAGFDRYGSWTPGRQAWAHKILLDHVQRDKHQAERSAESGFEKIVQHLQSARDRREDGGSGLLNPCVRIGSGDPDVLGGVKFALKLTGKRSKRPGHVSVAESHRFGEGDFYGYINPDGEFDGYSKCTEGVRNLLRRIATNPAAEIVAIGKESGLCCYCYVGLTQVQSKIAGCGKTCANNYGVWYPNAEETRRFVDDCPQVLIGATDRERWEK